MMKAAIRHEYCSPEQLQISKIPIPLPGDHEVLVKVKATTVNRTDCAVLTGNPWAMRCFTGMFKPTRPVIGTDFSGIVVANGIKANQFDIGDNVYGFFDQGLSTQAEYVAVNVKKAILKKPENVTFEQAVASLEGAHYAFYFLAKMKLNQGAKVLVNGGTGAVGNAAVQFLKHFKIEVTVTCETEYMDVLKLQGADRVIDYQNEDFTKLDDQFDYVFDAVGKSSFAICKPLLKPKGIYISSELGAYWQNPLLALLAPFMSGKKVKFPLPSSINRSLNFIDERVRNGEFKPLIDRRYRLDEISTAYNYVISGKKRGNVIITFD